MQADIRIQKAQPLDLPEVKKLLINCDLPSHDLSEAHMKHFHLVKEDGEVSAAGGLEVYDSDGLLRSLAVNPSLRKQGLGKKLTNQIEEYAREMGIRRIFLLTTTAEAFFADRGYEEVNREELPEKIRNSPQFADICPSTAVAMGKVL